MQYNFTLDGPDEGSLVKHRSQSVIYFHTDKSPPVSGLMMQMEGSGDVYTRGEKWRVECIECKGMGVIATADIKQGEELTSLISCFVNPLLEVS